MIRHTLRIGAVAMALWLSCVGTGPAQGAEQADMPLPSGVKPFTGTIVLRYRGFERFTLTWRADIVTPPRATIAEGWVMQGTMHVSGDDLTWSYRLANIGHDEVEREGGRLEVTTDAWGQVRRARVTSRQWPQPRGDAKALSDWLFDEQELRFLPCCCPREALRMGDVVAIPPNGETMPRLPTLPPDVEASMKIRERTEQTIVAGILDTDQGRQLVIRHRADMVADTSDGLLATRRSGFSLIDIRTCLPVRSVWATSVSMPGKPDLKPFTIIHRIEARP